MSSRIRDFAINSLLVVFSFLFGLLTINQLILYVSNNNSQRQYFPRKLLGYLEPVARWTYPDYKNSDNNSKALFIVGDSYAEGQGDLMLQDSYKYSIGHFLDEKWRKNTNIFLAANGGSHIPAQLFFLENHLRGDSKNLTGNPIKSDIFNVILYFYEGNDLHNTFIGAKLPFQSSRSKLRFQFPIYYALRTAVHLINEKISLIFTRELSLTKENNLPNKICVKNICRRMPLLESAPIELSEKQIINQITYLEDSVKKFSLNYPKANICFVYIPSPATIYSPKQEFYPVRVENPQQIKIDAKSNNIKSLQVRRLLKDRMQFGLMTFVDTTKTLQNHALKKFLHGKLDLTHFNGHGYKLIAEVTSQGCSLI